jgi:hypothetical protein
MSTETGFSTLLGFLDPSAGRHLNKHKNHSEFQRLKAIREELVTSAKIAKIFGGNVYIQLGHMLDNSVFPHLIYGQKELEVQRLLQETCTILSPVPGTSSSEVDAGDIMGWRSGNVKAGRGQQVVYSTPEYEFFNRSCKGDRYSDFVDSMEGDGKPYPTGYLDSLSKFNSVVYQGDRHAPFYHELRDAITLAERHLKVPIGSFPLFLKAARQALTEAEELAGANLPRTSRGAIFINLEKLCNGDLNQAKKIWEKHSAFIDRIHQDALVSNISDINFASNAVFDPLSKSVEIEAQLSLNQNRRVTEAKEWLEDRFRKIIEHKVGGVASRKLLLDNLSVDDINIISEALIPWKKKFAVCLAKEDIHALPELRTEFLEVFRSSSERFDKLKGADLDQQNSRIKTFKKDQMKKLKGLGLPAALAAYISQRDFYAMLDTFYKTPAPAASSFALVAGYEVASYFASTVHTKKGIDRLASSIISPRSVK